MSEKTVIIAAGGTGGHLYPGLALARELKKRGCRVLFAVKENDICREILAEEGLSFVEVPVRGLPRALSPKLFVFGFLLVRSFFSTLKLLGGLRPDYIVGMGGYISFPVVLAGKVRGIRTVIHEQNYIPGLANRVLSRIADRVGVSFPEALNFFPAGKTSLTGNPVRTELFRPPDGETYRRLKLSPEKSTVLVVGGSLGAARVNRTVIEAYAKLPSKENVQFLHIAGKKDYESIAAAYAERKLPGTVLAYLHAMGDAYAAADLIICRAGATTVAELMVLNKPSILVPYPHATANHQEYNAKALVKSGHAVLIREKDLTPEILAGEIEKNLKHFDPHRKPQPAIPKRLAQEVLADLVLS